MTTLKAEFAELMALVHEEFELSDEDHEQCEASFYAGAMAFYKILCAGQKANDPTLITKAYEEILERSASRTHELRTERQVRDN